MNCTDYRNRLLAAPHSPTAAMSAHADECEPCATFARDLSAMDAVLHDALAVDVPDNLGQTRLLQKIAQRRRRALALYAVAATLLVAVGLFAGLNLEHAPSPIPADLVAHIRHEPALLVPTTQVLPIERVSTVLREGRVTLTGPIGSVHHAGLCPFRGNLVAHLVVETPSGPVTVMLLPDETVRAPVRFDEDGLRGVLVPAGRGSIAVIGDEPDALEPVRKRFSRAVEYSI